MELISSVAMGGVNKQIRCCIYRIEDLSYYLQTTFTFRVPYPVTSRRAFFCSKVFSLNRLASNACLSSAYLFPHHLEPKIAVHP